MGRGNTSNPAGVVSSGYTQAQIEAIAIAAAEGASPTLPFSYVSTISASAVQAAVDALPSTGGTVMLPAGQGDFTDTVDLRTGVTIQGQGTTTTKIIVKGDYPAFNMIGASTSNRLHRVRLRNFTVNREDNASYTSSALVFAQYGDTCVFDNVNFERTISVGFEATDFWDSIFINCRWDHCGGDTGARPATLIYNGASGNSNNLAFYNCTWESFRDGGVWVIGETNASALVSEVFHFFNCKWDCVGTNLGPAAIFSQVTQIKIYGGSVSINAPAAAAPAAYDQFIFRKNARDISVRDFQSLWGGSQTQCDSFLFFDGSVTGNTGIVIDNVSGSTNSTSGPTDGLVKFSGTNDWVQIGPVYWRRNGGTYALFSGSPTTVTPGMRLRTKAGTFSDSDFSSSVPGTPGGGAQFIGVDTSNNRLYLRYADGTYKYVALT